MSNENEVQIQINTVDNTGDGIEKINNRFKSFDETLENPEKNLKTG